MEITAAVARSGEADFVIQQVELDAPREDEILVRIVGVGLCHTDLVARDGAFGLAYPAVFGHEGSGVVDQVGTKVKKVKKGDRVAITFRSCGECARCKRGEPAYCHTLPLLNFAGMRPDGSKAIRSGDEPVTSNFFGQSSFATYALTYERNVVKVPGGVPLELVGPLGCGIQTGAGGIMRSLACEAGSTLLITGGGAVGLSAVMGAAIQQCATIIVVEPHAVRRQLALELGATHVIDPIASPDLAVAVRAIVEIGVDYAFDTTGRPDTLQAIMGCLGPHGTLGIVGVPPPGTPVPGDLTSVITFGHIIKGIIEGDSDPDVFIPEMIAHYLAGRLPFDRLIRTYPLTEINKAIADQHHGDCVKVVLLTGQTEN
ncbi:NAD(P)-dependent alcohol dehydrogenase [Oleomonas cavernae]|uniref:NAD(P)-dependent alcohol dehydrogenase n=1 Tax=Oleomonas cavernae TaxID=2320859 RepID=A0A418WST7_9PROT|nr:NAD(P)-dependent alcohol dehydrogenase [Oleomonas cavernae]RJF94328.1 NAD(P)-dependent alcohol dehydrogenase [Oleomonas cavernae]